MYTRDSHMVTNNITTELLNKINEVYSHETNIPKFKHDLINEHDSADMKLSTPLNRTALNQSNCTCLFRTEELRLAVFYQKKNAYNLRYLLPITNEYCIIPYVQGLHTYYLATHNIARLKRRERIRL